jgi:1,4-dihydroxy-2-naphthoate octaprenyltransferase
MWRLADPKISLASFASIFLGASAAADGGPVSFLWLAFTVGGIFAIEVAKNASGEIFDFDSGADAAVAARDRSPFSGGKRVMVDQLLTRGQTWVVAAGGYGLGVVIGLGIVVFRESAVLWLGLAGVACAFLYHAPPVKLSYRGLGEFSVALCYGPLICGGTYLVQRGTIGAPVVLLSLPLGLLIAAFLWINEFPDYLADKSAGKRNLVVRLGRKAASRVFVIFIVIAFTGVALLPLAGLPPAVWLGGVALVPAWSAARTLLAHPTQTARLVPAQARTLLAFVLLALGSGVGLLL